MIGLLIGLYTLIMNFSTVFSIRIYDKKSEWLLTKNTTSKGSVEN